MVSSSAKRSGFTLIDLLMLICISVLGIAIVMPMVAKADSVAAQVTCQSNLQQIGMALQSYNNRNGVMPWGEIPCKGHDEFGWPETLSQELGVSAPYMTSPVMACPNAVVQRQDQVEKSDVWFNYNANPRAMPFGADEYGLDCYLDLMNPVKCTQRSLESIQNPSAIALVWDGSQIEVQNWCAVYVVELAWGLGRAPAFVYPPRDKYSIPLDFYDGILPFDSTGSTSIDHNIDVPKSMDKRYSFVRYRHGNNDTINVLFADGHVEAKKYGEFLWRHVCMNYQ